MKLKKKRGINLITIFFILTTIVLATLLVLSNRSTDEELGYDRTAVLNRVVPIQELALVKYNYSGVIGFKDFLINVPLTEKSFLLKYNGHIKAGVDFEKMKIEVSNKDIHISLPRATILETAIDEKSIKVYNESMNAFNPLTIADYNKAIMNEKENMISGAISQGILKDAAKQAEMVLTTIMKDMGFENITITQEIQIPQAN